MFMILVNLTRPRPGGVKHITTPCLPNGIEITEGLDWFLALTILVNPTRTGGWGQPPPSSPTHPNGTGLMMSLTGLAFPTISCFWLKYFDFQVASYLLLQFLLLLSWKLMLYNRQNLMCIAHFINECQIKDIYIRNNHVHLSILIRLKFSLTDYFVDNWLFTRLLTKMPY